MSKGFRKTEFRLFALGALGYTSLELLCRGRTHWTMGLAGGLSLVCLWRIHKRRARSRLIAKCALGCAAITAIELATGLVANRMFRWNVWDYSANRLNFLGQICPMYSGLWMLLCAPVFAAFQRLSPRGAAQ